MCRALCPNPAFVVPKTLILNHPIRALSKTQLTFSPKILRNAFHFTSRAVPPHIPVSFIACSVLILLCTSIAIGYWAHRHHYLPPPWLEKAHIGVCSHFIGSFFIRTVQHHSPTLGLGLSPWLLQASLLFTCATECTAPLEKWVKKFSCRFIGFFLSYLPLIAVEIGFKLCPQLPQMYFILAKIGIPLTLWLATEHASSTPAANHAQLRYFKTIFKTSTIIALFSVYFQLCQNHPLMQHMLLALFVGFMLISTGYLLGVAASEAKLWAKTQQYSKKIIHNGLINASIRALKEDLIHISASLH
jgi:hypothetical protein